MARQSNSNIGEKYIRNFGSVLVEHSRLQHLNRAVEEEVLVVVVVVVVVVAAVVAVVVV